MSWVKSSIALSLCCISTIIMPVCEGCTDICSIECCVDEQESDGAQKQTRICTFS